MPLSSCEAVHNGIGAPSCTLPVGGWDEEPPMRRVRHTILLPIVSLLAAECATATCPLASSECIGVLRDVAQLGAHLDRLSRGERILSVQDVVAADGEPTTQ